MNGLSSPTDAGIERANVIDLAIIIVSWNVRPLLQQCLKAIYASALYLGTPDEVDLRVIVVDGASTDGSPKMVHDLFPQVQLITNNQNIGFTRGNNQALRALGFRARQEGKSAPRPPVDAGGGLTAAGAPSDDAAVDPLPRYVMLLNPDTEVASDALARMVDFMDAHPDVGIVGPQLRYPDGKIQPSRRRFPTLGTAFLESTILQQWWPRNPAALRYYVSDVSADEIQDVDWVVGACMMVRQEAIAAAGLLDEGFFMYSEELDWCRRIKHQGWRIVYLPTAKVLHREGKSSEQVLPARHIHFQRSKIRYFRKYHGRLVAAILRIFLLTTYAYQFLLEAGKWLLGHKRSIRRERMSAYLAVLRSGL